MICPKCGKEMMQKSSFAKGGGVTAALLSGLAGAGEGATAGSIIPGAGTAVGAVIGFVAGAFAGGAAGAGTGAVIDHSVKRYKCPDPDCGFEC